MPSLRVVTWNAGGEDNLRAQALDQIILDINGAVAGNAGDPHVQLVALQEMHQIATGAVFQHIQNGAGVAGDTFEHFAAPAHIGERIPGQGLNNAKGYVMAHRNGGNGPTLVPRAGLPGTLRHIDVRPRTGVGDLGVINGINNHVPPANSGLVRASVSDGVRYPVLREFSLVTMGNNHRVKVITWHAPLKGDLQITWGKNWKQGSKQFMQLLERSTWWNANITHPPLAQGDVAILLGDLNASSGELGQPGILTDWEAASNNLCHILAFSPDGHGGNAALVNDGGNYPPGFPPHDVVTARITW